MKTIDPKINGNPMGAGKKEGFKDCKTNPSPVTTVKNFKAGKKEQPNVVSVKEVKISGNYAGK